MNERLKAIYRLIPPGKGVIDVGTDHGYIPVCLAGEGYPGRIIALDIRSGPLAAAKRTAERAGLSDRIEFLLCDGLDGCPPDAVDTIVIAGMGGDAICGILDRAEWCMAPAYKLILQPMTKQEVLRYWLVNNGFKLEEEQLVEDRGVIYQILTARYTGINERLTDAELYVGSFEKAAGHPLFAKLLEQENHRFSVSLAGQEQAGLGRDSMQQSIYEELLSMREKLHE